MSNSQKHGKQFENIIKSFYLGASDSSRSATSFWDIESKFDKKDNLPTNIKSTKRGMIELADARRFFSLNETFRLLVGKYNQIGEKKSFYEIREYIIDLEILRKLKGSLSYDVIEKFHNKIKENSKMDICIARSLAKDHNDQIKINFDSFIYLNPKVGSGNNRLQCSISIAELDKFVNPKIFTESYGDICLPITILSSKRERK